MKKFLRGVGIFLALVGVGILSAFAVVALLLQQEEVRVPDLTGQEIVTVIEAVNQLGVQLKIDRRESNPILPRDTIISQTPPGGSGIKKGRQVHVVLSLGPSEMQTPNLIGEHYRRADIMIRQAGFLPGTLSRISSDTVERDAVVAQAPPPESPMDRGGRISLLVSTGKKTDLLVMPDLSGKMPEEAATMISRMGLQYRILHKSQGDREPAGRLVVSQKPASGSPVMPDALVEIVVNK